MLVVTRNIKQIICACQVGRFEVWMKNRTTVEGMSHGGRIGIGPLTAFETTVLRITL